MPTDTLKEPTLEGVMMVLLNKPFAVDIASKHFGSLFGLLMFQIGLTSKCSHAILSFDFSKLKLPELLM